MDRNIFEGVTNSIRDQVIDRIMQGCIRLSGIDGPCPIEDCSMFMTRAGMQIRNCVKVQQATSETPVLEA